MAQVVEMKRERPRDELFEVMAEVCEIDISQLTKTARGALNRACSELREINPSPEEVRRKASMYREKFEGMPVTPNALVKHWPQLNPPPEDRWKMANRIAKENGLELYKGHPHETPDQFMKRIGV